MYKCTDWEDGGWLNQMQETNINNRTVTSEQTNKQTNIWTCTHWADGGGLNQMQETNIMLHIKKQTTN